MYSEFLICKTLWRYFLRKYHVILAIAFSFGLFNFLNQSFFLLILLYKIKTQCKTCVRNTRKVTNIHHIFSLMEACAIICFNTGYLVFKDTCPKKQRVKDIGARWCLFLGCDGRDSYAYVRFASLQILTMKDLTRITMNVVAKFNGPTSLHMDTNSMKYCHEVIVENKNIFEN